MKSKIWIVILCLETALACLIAAAIATKSYGLLAPMLLTTAPRNIVGNSTPISNRTAAGLATWYSVASTKVEKWGKRAPIMSNGALLRDSKMTCALWITNSLDKPCLPDGRLVKITNVRDGREVVCVWSDNGPGCVPRSRGVICDLTPAAFAALGGKLKDGKIEVTVEGIP